MKLTLFLTFFILLYLFAIVRRFLDNRPDKSYLGYLDFNQKYLSRLREIPSVRILRLYSQIDAIMIQSLLDSAKINSYLEFPHMAKLYAGFAIPGYCDSYLIVERKDLYDAKRIIVQYLRFNRNKNRKNYKIDFRQMAEILIGGYSVPAGKNRNLPEILV